MPDDYGKETVKKAPNKVKIEIVSAKEKTTLVKYMDGDNLCLVYVPTNKVKDSKVEEPVLKKGVPYGLPWEKVELPEITGEQLAAALHKHNIWTAEECRRNPNGVRAAINQLYGKPLAILTQFIQEENRKASGGK